MSEPVSVLRRAGRSSRLLFGPEGRKVIAGILLIVFVLYGQELYGVATAGGRLAPSLRGVTGPSNVIVVLNFTPERFHNERVREYGVFSGRDGALNRIRLRMVTPDNLDKLANLAWVARIEPLK